MRDDSSIDPTGIQQQPPQAAQAAAGPAMTEPARGAAEVPAAVPATPPRATGDVQAQPATAPEQGMAPEPSAAHGIWDATKAAEFRERWHEVQTHFVEDPRGSVTEARQLVDEAVQTLAASVHDREEQLEHAGARAADSTEGMRDTVLQYHHLLDRLLAV